MPPYVLELRGVIKADGKQDAYEAVRTFPDRKCDSVSKEKSSRMGLTAGWSAGRLVRVRDFGLVDPFASRGVPRLAAKRSPALG